MRKRDEPHFSKRDGLTQAALKTLLAYEPATGRFTWRVKRFGARPGAIAGGSRKHDGYWRISFNGHRYLAHRLAWLYVYGVWPSKQIDHINGNRCDNRIKNLRDVDQYQNCQNQKVHRDSKSAIKGVYRHQGRWHAEIMCEGIRARLGSYATAAEAKAARAVFERRIAGPGRRGR